MKYNNLNWDLNFFSLWAHRERHFLMMNESTSIQKKGKARTFRNKQTGNLQRSQKSFINKSNSTKDCDGVGVHSAVRRWNSTEEVQRKWCVCFKQLWKVIGTITARSTVELHLSYYQTLCWPMTSRLFAVWEERVIRGRDYRLLLQGFESNSRW